MLIIICVFFIGFLILASLILTIVGAVKKNKKLLFGGIAGFFVFGIANGLIIACSISSAIDSITSSGVLETMEEVSENGGKIAGTVVKGSISGMSNELGTESVAADSSVIQAGITINHAENLEGQRVSIYLDFAMDFDGALILYAYDANDKKQGIARKEVHVKAGDEGVHTFDFEEGSNSGFDGYYVLVARPE